jgi:hypothetical protein
VNGFSTVSRAEGNPDVQHGDAHFALLPVWMLNTQWNGKTYTFVMNGQTGKMIGDLPVDKKKFWKRVAMYTGIFTGIFSVIGAVFCLFL